jgi:thiaminase
VLHPVKVQTTSDSVESIYRTNLTVMSVVRGQLQLTAFAAWLIAQSVYLFKILRYALCAMHFLTKDHWQLTLDLSALGNQARQAVTQR